MTSDIIVIYISIIGAGLLMSIVTFALGTAIIRKLNKHLKNN